MVPGMDHCGIQTNGPGIADTGIDPLTALEQWVEKGKPPTELIATTTAPTGNQIKRCGSVLCARTRRLLATRPAIRPMPPVSLAQSHMEDTYHSTGNVFRQLKVNADYQKHKYRLFAYF
jgi:hypothetical protein